MSDARPSHGDLYVHHVSPKSVIECEAEGMTKNFKIAVYVLCDVTTRL